MSTNGTSLIPAVASSSGLDSAPVVDPVTAGGEEREGVNPFKRAHQLLRGRYHWATLLAVILGSAGAVGGWFMKEPMYESVGMIRIRPYLDQVLYKTAENAPIHNFGDYVAAEVQNMTSERVILRAMESPDMQATSLQPTNSVINDLRESILIKQLRGYVVRLGYEDRDPAVARAVVRSVVASYMDLYGAQEDKKQAEIMRLLRDRQSRLTSELNAMRDRVFAIATQNSGIDLDKELEARQQSLYALQAQISEIEAILTERGVDADNLTPPKDVRDMTLEEMEALDPGVLGQLIAVKRKLDAEMEVLRLQYGPQQRLVRQLQMTIDINNNRIAERRQQLIEGTAFTVKRSDDALLAQGMFGLQFKTTDELRRLLQKSKQDEEQARRSLLEISQRKGQLDLLREEMENTRKQLADVRLSITAREVESSNNQKRIEVVNEGTSPVEPTNGGKRKQLAALGGMAGASLGVTIVLLFGLADPRLRTIDDARTGLFQTRMLGILPSLPEDLADPQQASVAAHCVHHIRTMLQVGVAPDQPCVYSITSPGAGTGKTSLTLALGLSFAASDARTLLIDCDLVGGGLTRRVAAVVRRRIGHLLQKHGLVTQQQIEEALHTAQARQIRLGEALIELGYIKAADLDRVLNLQEQSLLGVMDACNGEAFDHCIAETGVKNLSILPTGTAMARHAASLSPAAVSRLVATARSKFDIVLIDTGPILGSLEASVVAGTVDGTVLIVSRGDHRAVCDKSVEYLQSIRANLMGIVFNRAEVHDFERSSFTSLASLTSLRPNDGEVVEGEVIDGEASSRLGPVGSAVVSNSRIARNGRQTRSS